MPPPGPAGKRCSGSEADGDRLCDLLKTYDLGVHTTTRTVEDITIDSTFFTDM
jgi:restriction endonuclease Mrr